MLVVEPEFVTGSACRRHNQSRRPVVASARGGWRSVRLCAPRTDPSRTLTPDEQTKMASYPAKPGSDSSRMARNGASASSWHSTPIPPIHTRWISRYDAGRFSFSAIV